MSTVASALAEAAAALCGRSESAELDAALLLAQVLGCSRSLLATRGERPLAPAESAAFRSLVGRRADGEPVAYLTGRRGFWTLELEVTPDVLVPRPESELLVELALARLAGARAPAILDLGTGSGALAIALACERPDASVTAVDVSAAALAVARRNAAQAGASGIEFLEGHWYAPVAGRRFDVIVANPPYVAEDDPHLERLRHEPRMALAAGPDGLRSIRELCASAPRHLSPAGALIIEHGSTQGAAVRQLCAAAGLAGAATHPDLAGLERTTLACAPASRAAGG